MTDKEKLIRAFEAEALQLPFHGEPLHCAVWLQAVLTTNKGLGAVGLQTLEAHKYVCGSALHTV